jgi:hypothetical protein
MYSTFEGIIHQRTSRGVFFQGHYWEVPLWLPTSQVNLYHDEGLSVILMVKDWLCDKKGLLEFTFYSEAEIKTISGY